MNPGALDRLITVQALAETRDTGGGVVSAWTSLPVKIWARRTDKSGREFRAANSLNAEVTATYTIRAYVGLTTKHRFLDGGVAYDIVYVQPTGRTGYQEIQARAINP
jgi:SPP1 family predicted phage head-tail adaptor